MPEDKRGGLPELLANYTGYDKRTELLELMQRTLAETKYKMEQMLHEREEAMEGVAAMQPPEDGKKPSKKKKKKKKKKSTTQ